MRTDPRTPHPSRLAPEHAHFDVIMDAHARACADGSPGYLDPITGLFTMTADYHLQRGTCCDNGCRHCPYLETA
ncbi:MAG: hypothetical protein FJW97_07815 [Actinobacteria bacterium]|nr:hypothetical protein [Actinomycetota bacterium]